MLIVLTGIDGSGKTTAARATVAAARRTGKKALLLRNYAGRRRMSLLSAQFGIQLHPRLADAVETAVRTANVVVSHARAHRHPGLVIMDRHLHCQLALRQARGLPRGRLLPFLLAKFPQPDVVIHLVIDPEQAHQRVLARGTDTETLGELYSLRAAYRAMPEYAHFTELAASGTPEEVFSDLALAIADAGKSRGEPLAPTP
ncbi:thymidylate kinase [Arthrobacter sp. ES3-54]|uniref:thymidylate kinase n=1 Tax=Arthrobacter sp. ES3-54 TaxID=1502991 RepID=UPI0024065DF8|nr:thymidylate kinase [Arthrobacter sp. ES3-54]MDF9749337.1 dTMP kinase [Arthrobacter sp. ES3-54]